MVYGVAKMRKVENIIYPAGHHAVGKTELCDYLVERYGFEVIETGAMVRSLYTARDSKYQGLDLGEFIKQAEIDLPMFFDTQLVDKINQLDNHNGRIIVNGMRSLVNIERLKGGTSEMRHSIIWLDAQIESLLERYNARENKNLELDEFIKLLDFDLELGLAEIRENADFIVENNSSVDELRSNADQLMIELGITALKLV